MLNPSHLIYTLCLFLHCQCIFKDQNSCLLSFLSLPFPTNSQSFQANGFHKTLPKNVCLTYNRIEKRNLERLTKKATSLRWISAPAAALICFTLDLWTLAWQVWVENTRSPGWKTVEDIPAQPAQADVRWRFQWAGDLCRDCFVTEVRFIGLIFDF